MDFKEKLEKAATLYAYGSEEPTVKMASNAPYYTGFKSGAEWLQSQPITDRLTEGDVNNLNDVMFLMRRMAAAHQMSYDCLKQISNTLYDVFGKEIFIERQSKYAVVNTAIFGKEMFEK